MIIIGMFPYNCYDSLLSTVEGRIATANEHPYLLKLVYGSADVLYDDYRQHVYLYLLQQFT